MTCAVDTFLASLGKTKLLVGAQRADDDITAVTQAPWDIRYRYLSAGIPDGAGPCATCQANCTAKGTSCKNSAGGCAWWGCWQSDTNPPGDYVRSLISESKAKGQFAMVTYYNFFQASGLPEGPGQLVKANDAVWLARYLNDWRFVLQQVGQEVVLLHIEPDLWGYGQQLNANPHLIAAKVKTANPTDCAAIEDSFAGLGKCMIAMTRKYAPKAKVALQASAWATGIDVALNTNASFDMVGEATKVANYMIECGASDGDYLVVEASDRDYAWYATQGQPLRQWDPTNATLPNFTQHFTWASTIAKKVGKALVWWQVPVGHAGLPNMTQKWKDNRVDYFFAHTAEVAKAYGAAMVFGPGDGNQTTPSTDNGNLVAKVTAYKAGSGQAPCPP